MDCCQWISGCGRIVFDRKSFCDLGDRCFAPVIMNILCFHIFMMPFRIASGCPGLGNLEFLRLSASSRLYRAVCEQTPTMKKRRDVVIVQASNDDVGFADTSAFALQMVC